MAERRAQTLLRSLGVMMTSLEIFGKLILYMAATVILTSMAVMLGVILSSVLGRVLDWMDNHE